MSNEFLCFLIYLQARIPLSLDTAESLRQRPPPRAQQVLPLSNGPLPVMGDDLVHRSEDTTAVFDGGVRQQSVDFDLRPSPLSVPPLERSRALLRPDQFAALQEFMESGFRCPAVVYFESTNKKEYQSKQRLVSVCLYTITLSHTHTHTHSRT